MMQKTYFPYDYYCFRLPAKSLDHIAEINQWINEINMDSSDDILNIIDVLFEDNDFKEAIYISSRDLYHTYQEFRFGEDHDLGKARRFLMSFYKYYSRMCQRPTPYGVFAGTASGITAESSQVIIDPSSFRPYIQFNMESITDWIRSQDPSKSAFQNVPYKVNNTLYTVGERLYYVEKVEKNGYLASNLTSIGLNPYIEKILEVAKEGATLQTLCDSLEIPEVSTDQVQNFVNSLIKSQVLLSDLWPSVASDDFTKDFLKKADNYNVDDPFIEQLGVYHRLFRSTGSIGEIGKIRDHITTHQDAPFSIKHDWLKLDLFMGMHQNQIKGSVINKIHKQSGELFDITTGRTVETLQRFINAFLKKYEEREVPLATALDPNFGVGYGLVVGSGLATYTPLIDQIRVTYPMEDAKINPASKMTLLRRKALNRYLETQNNTIYIDEDIKRWRNESPNTSSTQKATSSYIFGSLLAESEIALDEGKFTFDATQLHAPYATRMLSRFINGDAVLKDKVQRTIADERQANSNVILAEIINIPDGKFANISLYPHFREFEIPYMSNSEKDSSHQLLINDLKVSIRRGRVVLRSERLQKEVIPCITNTYDSGFGNPLYQFLAAVSYQNTSNGFLWHWGPGYQTEKFLPRIQYKNIIVSRARWYLQREKKIPRNEKEYQNFVDTLISKYNLPRYFVIAEGDNEFVIDIQNNICQQIFIKKIKKRNLHIYEHLKSKANSFIKDDSGKKYANEMLIPIGQKQPMVPYPFNNNEGAQDGITRIFSPGSEWLFVKIYAGSKIVEKILTELVPDFCKEKLDKDIIDKWFFLRFNDPDYHLRIRFHRNKSKDDQSGWYQLLEDFQLKIHQLIAEEHAVKITVETYQREIERYGPTTMELSESLFYNDSQALCAFLEQLQGNLGEQVRWRFGLISVDAILSDFGFIDEQKMEFMKHLSANFYNEFNEHAPKGDKTLKVSLDQKYRTHQDEIYKLIRPEITTNFHENYSPIIEKRSVMNQDILAGLPENLPKYFLHDLIASHIHMNMNRLFLVHQRKHEMVIYHFLFKCYTSIVARKKQVINEY